MGETRIKWMIDECFEVRWSSIVKRIKCYNISISYIYATEKGRSRSIEEGMGSLPWKWGMEETLGNSSLN